MPHDHHCSAGLFQAADTPLSQLFCEVVHKLIFELLGPKFVNKITMLALTCMCMSQKERSKTKLIYL